MGQLYQTPRPRKAAPTDHETAAEETGGTQGRLSETGNDTGRFQEFRVEFSDDSLKPAAGRLLLPQFPRLENRDHTSRDKTSTTNARVFPNTPFLPAEGAEWPKFLPGVGDSKGLR